MTHVIETDTVIVGSGVAGALVAYRLVQKGVKVLLLEAGPRISRQEALDRFYKAPVKHNQSPYPQKSYALHEGLGQDALPYIESTGKHPYYPLYIRAVGGTTWHWAGESWRFLPSDFKLKSIYGVGRDWPLTYSEIEPYYLEAEKELGVSGEGDLGSPRSQPYPMPPTPLTYWDKTLQRYVKPLGMDVVVQPAARNTLAYDGRPPCCGSHSCMPLCPVGAQYSGDIHVQKAEHAGATLIAEAVVDRLFVGKKNRIEALTFKDPKGQTHRVHAKRFVIAANGIETPKLLLNSRSSQAPQGIANSSDQVGRNLMDHPGYKVEFLMPEPVYIGRGPVEVGAITTFREGSFRKDYASAKIGVWNSVPPLEPILERALKQGLAGKELAQYLSQDISRRCTLTSFHEQLPSPDNRVLLSKKTDILGIPHPQIVYSPCAYTLKSVEHMRQVFQKIMKAVQADDVNYGSTITTNNHIMGTTIMGEDPKNSVVNRHCQSHDHENLFVASSSVFASTASVNCTLTIAALSLRLADYLI